MIPGRRGAALGILVGVLLGGCASEPSDQAPVPPAEPQPVPISIALDAGTAMEPATVECDADLLEPWLRRGVETAAAGPSSLGRTIEFAASPGRLAGQGLIQVEPVQDWLAEATAAGDADPSLGLLAAINGDGEIDLTAIVSPDLGNGQALVLRGRAERIEFADGVGIRYLAAYTDDYAPLTDADLYYLYEGLTRDGLRYVSLRLPIAAAALPDAPEPGTLEAAAEFAAITDTYVDSLLEQLAQADEATFRPSLARLDEFVRSIVVR